MPDFLRVPWVEWKNFRIEGVVRELESKRALRGMVVRAKHLLDVEEI